ELFLLQFPLASELMLSGGQAAAHGLDGFLLLGDTAPLLSRGLACLVEPYLALFQRRLGLGEPAPRQAIPQPDQRCSLRDRLPFLDQHIGHTPRLHGKDGRDAVLQIDLAEADDALRAGAVTRTLVSVLAERRRLAA